MEDKMLNPFSTEIDETIERYQWFNLLEATLIRDTLEHAYMRQKTIDLQNYDNIEQDYKKITKWHKLVEKLNELIKELKNAQKNPEDH